jgi:hypothetical protein
MSFTCNVYFFVDGCSSFVKFCNVILFLFSFVIMYKFVDVSYCFLLIYCTLKNKHYFLTI